MRQVALLAVAGFIVGQGLFSEIERKIFWGEMLILLFFLDCLRSYVYKNREQRAIIGGVTLWLFIFPVYATIISVSFYYKELLGYYFLRHLNMFYYAMFFFIAYRWGSEILAILSEKVVLFFVLGCFVFFGFSLSIATSMLLGLFCTAVYIRWGSAFKEAGVFQWGLYITLVLSFLFFGYGGTGKVTLIMLLALPLFIRFYFVWSRFQPSFLRKIWTNFLTVIVVGIITYFLFEFIDLIYQMKGTGHTIASFEKDFVIEDPNSIWRLLLWSYLLERAWQHPLGIGIGTPIFDGDFILFLNLPWRPEEPYVMGAHNSFLTFLVRVGWVYIPFLFYISKKTGNLFIRYLQIVECKVRRTKESYVVFLSFVAFLMCVIQSSFNHVLESPRFAGTFWFSFGLFVRLCGDFVGDHEEKIAASAKPAPSV